MQNATTTTQQPVTSRTANYWLFVMKRSTARGGGFQKKTILPKTNDEQGLESLRRKFAKQCAKPGVTRVALLCRKPDMVSYDYLALHLQPKK